MAMLPCMLYAHPCACLPWTSIMHMATVIYGFYFVIFAHFLYLLYVRDICLPWVFISLDGPLPCYGYACCTVHCLLWILSAHSYVYFQFPPCSIGLATDYVNMTTTAKYSYCPICLLYACMRSITLMKAYLTLPYLLPSLIGIYLYMSALYAKLTPCLTCVYILYLCMAFVVHMWLSKPIWLYVHYLVDYYELIGQDPLVLISLPIYRFVAHMWLIRSIWVSTALWTTMTYCPNLPYFDLTAQFWFHCLCCSYVYPVHACLVCPCMTYSWPLHLYVLFSWPMYVWSIHQFAYSYMFVFHQWAYSYAFMFHQFAYSSTFMLHQFAYSHGFMLPQFAHPICVYSPSVWSLPIHCDFAPSACPSRVFIPHLFAHVYKFMLHEPTQDTCFCLVSLIFTHVYTAMQLDLALIWMIMLSAYPLSIHMRLSLPILALWPHVFLLCICSNTRTIGMVPMIVSFSLIHV